MDTRILEKSELEKAIVRAIVFFDMFEYPLTASEIFWYADQPATLEAVLAALNHLERETAAPALTSRQGFYFFPGRENIVAERARRFNFTAAKFKIARRVSRVFRFIPFIDMIAVSNIVGSHNLRAGSDIDLFIITRPGRIWLTRFLCAGPMKLLNLRPNKVTKKNKICLSFYITTANLDLVRLKLPAVDLPAGADDYYFNYWLAGLVPIYDRGGVYAEFMAANSWLKKYLPNFAPAILARLREIKPVYKKRENRPPAANALLARLEKLARNFQLKILPENLRALMNQDTRVIINDQILKLYLVDRRAEFLARYQEKLKTLNL